MNNTPSLHIRRATSMATQEHIAVAQIRHLIEQDRLRLILFFCSTSYDLARLASELRNAFGDTPVIGCTTIGQLGLDGYTRGGISAISLAGDIAAHPFAVDLAAMEGIVPRIADETRRIIALHPDQHPFGLLLVDGMSLMEEQLASLLYRCMPHVPIVGGSASDDLSLRQTHVYVDGEFRTHTAVFTLFRTRLPFRAIRFAHFVPTDTTLVVTRSDQDKRMVYEINGEPAAQVYAALAGVHVAQLDMPIFCRHPLVFEMGGEQYIRAIVSANPDQSLTLYCIIENGMVLSLGRAVDPAATALAAFDRLREDIGEPALVIGFDCILRRLEFEGSGLLDAMGDIMKRNQVFGFSTYGEQFDGLHMNQTFTGVAIGTGDARA
jgi:hypothetical protein